MPLPISFSQKIPIERRPSPTAVGAAGSILYPMLIAVATGILAISVSFSWTTPRIRLVIDGILPNRPITVMARHPDGQVTQLAIPPFDTAAGYGHATIRLSHRPVTAMAVIVPTTASSPTRIHRLEIGAPGHYDDRPPQWLKRDRRLIPETHPAARNDATEPQVAAWSADAPLIDAIDQYKHRVESIRRWLAAAGVALACLVFFWLPPMRSSLSPVIGSGIGDPIPDTPAWDWAMGLAWCAAAAVAVLSPWNAHPDEVHHVQAAVYYYDHWVPPHILSLNGGWHFSKYGASYLFTPDMAYFLAGKFGAVLGSLGLNPTMAFRVFNLTLLAALVLLYRRFRYGHLLLLLVSPQIWYIFSYANNDAFPLFVGLFSLQFALPRSTSKNDSFRHGIRAVPPKTYIAWGICMALLLVCKRNYLPLYLFFIMLVSIAIIKMPPGQRKRQGIGYACALMAGLAIVGACALTDAARHGWQRAEAIASVTGANASLAYSKESTVPGADSVPWVRLRAKGTPLPHLFTRWNWHGFSFKSFFGVYGWMRYYSPNWLYGGVLFLLVAAGLIKTNAVLRHGVHAWHSMVVIGTGSGLLIAAAVWHAWVNDFQPQGRYLFPLVVMAASMVPYASPTSEKLLRIVLGFLFLLGMVSMTWVAIPGVG